MDMIVGYISNVKSMFHVSEFLWVYAICGAIFGSAMGSFTDVVADRTLENRKWWGRERSRCPSCNKVLGPLELIPVISFIIQKRRCRGCGSKIPYECLWAELGCAFLYGLLWGLHLPFTLQWTLGSLLIPLFMVHIITDLKSMVLCDSITLLIIICTFTARVYGSFVSNGYQIADGMLGSLIACGAFLAFSMLGLIGSGDTLLMAGLGMITGVYGILFNIYSASIMAVLYYTLITIFRCTCMVKKQHRIITISEAREIMRAGREVPYGPWLSLGSYFWLVFFV